ncbi:MarR family transcriptional regulator [Clostridium sp. D2Q-14]|uniref:MarR family winged helix-turn-helix transcriptional regulator n=1 Tax=Anaeromonas gelatinilytica TaxID=2683194 RepID=UPI00193B2631|nr:MarR family transcriptional regulator [Anaeromonas gelatinilytica]MBS4536360.1 MarR family transcriptional regulator [Anaeromonas gelatinilytica]
MKETDIDDINKNMLEFNNLFHSKISKVFRGNMDNKYRCNKNQNKAIMTIGKYDNISPSTLGKYLDMRKGSLTTLIDSLVEKNLILKEMDNNDRRRYLLSLTDEGKKYFENQREIFKNSIHTIFGKLNEDEIKIFSENMNKIVEIMKKV